MERPYSPLGESTSGVIRNVSIATPLDDATASRIYVAAREYDTRDNSRRILFARSTDGGTSWEPPVVLK